MNICIIYRDKIFVFNIGDSRTIAFRKDMFVQQLSIDHNVYNIFSFKDIKAIDGSISKDFRVGGVLSMSRAIGDMPLKLIRKIDHFIYNKSDYYMLCVHSDGLLDGLD